MEERVLVPGIIRKLDEVQYAKYVQFSHLCTLEADLVILFSSKSSDLYSACVYMYKEGLLLTFACTGITGHLQTN